MGKRIFDILGSLLLLIISLPVISAVALTVLVFSGSPIIFRQQRLGHRERLFTIYKFRTMVNGSENFPRAILGEDDAITGIGKWLRKFHLDELPQFWNVLKGDMSLVGPRPLPRDFGLNLLMLKCERYRDRFKVKPGLTGQMQIRGRLWVFKNVEEVVCLEADYACQHNLWQDLKIIFATMFVILKRQGI